MKSSYGVSRSGTIAKAKNISLGILLVSVFLFWCETAHAAITVSVSGPGGSVSQSVSDDGGSFDVNLPLNRNAVNNIVVTAEDAGGNSASANLAVTQVSLDQIVVSKVTSERLSVAAVEQLVADGVIDLDDPENYNVSTFDIVLTIDKSPVTVSVPIAVPIETKEETGFETYKRPKGGDSGGSSPNTPQIQIVVFQQTVPSEGGEANNITIPGVIIIEGNIRSLKEFFSVRLLLMNTSGIFTLSDVTAEIDLPEGALSNILPVDGINSFGDILPGDGDVPGQKEMEFIIRGDEIGVHDVTLNFGGSVTGPGILEPIAFNGSADTEVAVKGPPTFLVEVTHPDTVEYGAPYELIVDITNTGELTAMYASLELDVGADAALAKCELGDAGEPVCDYETGSEVRPFGHIEPGDTIRETFTVVPFSTGIISSCVAAADQNITLNVYMGSQGCMVGHYPPKVNIDDGIPTVTVVPAANTNGIHEDTPVTAFFSEKMNESSITTGENGDFNVYDSAGERIPGQLRFVTLFENTENEKTVAIWQVDGNSLASMAEYSVVVTTDILDIDGNALANRWESTFTTTDTGLNDTTPPSVSMSVAPPVSPNAVLPGQIININAYAADAGSGISRVELRLKDLDDSEGTWELVGQKTVFQGDRPPFIFAVDSGNLTPGHTVQAQATAYDGMGNAQNTTLALVILERADPPTVTLPEWPENPILQGISISLTPELTGGVRRVEYYLDGAVSPYKTVSLSPFKATLSTLALSLGAHTITVTAVDGLGQTGSAPYAFTLAENLNMPVVGFSNVVDGAVYEAGTTILIVGTAEDPVGVERITYWLDSTASTPLYSGFSSIRLNTAGIETGAHVIYIQAENALGIESDLAVAAAAFEFTLVDPPLGLPPASPNISIGFSEDGIVTCTGSTVAGAKVVITNTDMGISAMVYANSSGNFTGQVPGAEGDDISVVVYDLTASTDPSNPAAGVVPASPVLTSITMSPDTMVFDTAGAWQDITVTGHYESGESADLTGMAVFSTSDATVATVSTTGRVAGRTYGDAIVTATVDVFSAQTSVDVNIVTLTGIEVLPSSVSMIFIGETESLTVTGIYSDGSETIVLTELTYATGNPAVTTVTSAGIVTAAGNGATQINVSCPGVPAVAIPVSVNTGLDPAPTIAILSPADGANVERGDTVTVTVQANDDIGGVRRIYLETTGETVHTDNRQIAPPLLSVTQGFTFAVSDSAAIGGTITLEAWAEDTSDNTSPVQTIVLNVIDETAPSVTISAPTQQAPYNFGDTVNIIVEADDAVGISEIRYETTGALTESGSETIPGFQSAGTSFSFIVPYNISNPDVTIHAYAVDTLGNEGMAIPVDIILTDADITPPQTLVTAISDPGAGSGATVTYQVTDGMADLDYVALYFRKDGLGTFNRYTGALGDESGEYYPESGDHGTIAFDSTRMGGDGFYEFYTVGVDIVANNEQAPDDGAGNVLSDESTAFASGTIWTEITSSIHITAADASYDNQNIRISGSGIVVIMDGIHSLHNVELLDGAVLTHSETTTTDVFTLDFSAWTVSIDSNSAIDVTGLGYIGGREYNESGRTSGNVYGSTDHAGGSYGGLGGVYNSNYVAGDIYGSLTDPIDLGSGGGADGYTDGGDGGGLININAINVMVDGSMEAGGGESGGGSAGDGSGGGINLVTKTLSGQGSLTANGGGENSGVGAGGGRIAVRYLDMATMDINRITALGADGQYGNGANGTVYLKQEEDADGAIIITGRGAGSPWTNLTIPDGYSFDTVTLSNQARVLADDRITITGRLLVTGDSILSHTQGNEGGLFIEAATVQVDEGSAIDVTGRGYRGGTGHNEKGHTLGDMEGAFDHAGGSYGGLGAGYDNRDSYIVYGDPKQPDELGSGGGADGYTDGGNGGGRISINATDAVIVNGAVRANGGESGGGSAGDGSGGAVLVYTSRLAGTGTIEANGGGNGNGTAGGGGRIAIYCDYVDPSGNLADLYNITALAGHGQYDTRKASAGTAYIKYSNQKNGDLYIDDNVVDATASQSTPLPHIGFGTVGVLSDQSLDGSIDTLITDGLVRMLPNGLTGLRINPDINQEQSFAILGNTSSTITVITPNENNVDFETIAGEGSPYAGVFTYDNLTFRRGGNLVAGDLLNVTDTLTIGEYGLLTHFDATPIFISWLDLSVGNLVIEETGRIDVTGRGYIGGREHNESGRTSGNVYGSTDHAGGSYGGLGGVYNSNYVAGDVYGNLTDPIDLGSGGGADGYTDGGDGGGLIFITATDMMINGVVRSNGGESAGGSAGDGSGGTVNIVTSTLAGSGTIEADGGGQGTGVGGGGGRIAIDYDDTMTFPESSVHALGSQGQYGSRAGNGIVFFKKPEQTDGELVIDGLGITASENTTFIFGGYTFDNIILRNGAKAIADNGLTITGRLLVAGDSILSHTQGNEGGLFIEAATVQVDEGSAIDVTGRGYRGGTGHNEKGHTLGDMEGAFDHAGGSYGGLGAGYDNRDSYIVYGDPKQPDELGSGGGADGYTDGGNGGGRISINATDAVIVNGAVRANGGESGGGSAGDGSGGAVLVYTSRLAGTGTIEANGGGNGNGTAGGGGRIAIYCDYVDPSGNLADLYNITALAGHGQYDTRKASAGTAYIKYSNQKNGDLYIDDNVVDATASQSTPLPHIGFGTVGVLSDQSLDGSIDTLITDGLVRMLPNGLTGLRINPDINQEQSFAILGNTSSTITVITPNENNVDFETIAGEGSPYAGVFTYDNLTFRRGGNLVAGDLLNVTDTLTIGEYGLLTHFDATPIFISWLDLSVGNLVIEETGRIDVTGRGYIGGREHNESGRTSGNVYGSTDHAGGSYGGLGGVYNSNYVAGDVYGNLTDPIDLGSGGGADGYTDGGDGGGLIFITATDMMINGVVRSNGGESAGGSAGDGSGGTVNIVTSTLAGSGTIEADGGGQGTGVGGGGGRIAVYYDSLSIANDQITASGGDGSYADGENGTVHME